MSQWDELDAHDRAWALAVDTTDTLLEHEAAARKCPACGGDASECQDPRNQHAYDVVMRRCYRARAINDALKARKDDPDKASLIITTRLNPARQKPARRKG